MRNKDAIAWLPRGMRLLDAAAYLGIGKSKFLELVDEERLPKPMRIDGVVVWDRHELDTAIDALKSKEIEELLSVASEQMRLALHLLLYTGQRVGDVVTMKWSDISNGLSA